MGANNVRSFSLPFWGDVLLDASAVIPGEGMAWLSVKSQWARRTVTIRRQT